MEIPGWLERRFWGTLGEGTSTARLEQESWGERWGGKDEVVRNSCGDLAGVVLRVLQTSMLLKARHIEHKNVP